MSTNIRKREETKEKIRCSVMKLYSQKEISQITVTEVCQNAHIHRSTFYLHYESVDAVIKEVRQNLLIKLQALCGVDFTLGDYQQKTHQEIFDASRHSLIEQYHWLYSMRHYLIPLLGVNGDLYFIGQFEKIIYQTMERVSKQLDLQFSSKYAMIYVTGGIMKSNLHWLIHGDISAEELIDFQMAIIMQGFL